MKSHEAFVESARLAFAMYCDDNELTMAEGEELSDRISDALAFVAEDRQEYLPARLGGRA